MNDTFFLQATYTPGQVVTFTLYLTSLTSNGTSGVLNLSSARIEILVEDA
jgi:hypothetical protein